MIGGLILVGTLVFLAYKLGVAAERVRHAPGPTELTDDLRP